MKKLDPYPIKLFLSATIAIFVASFFQLQFAISAGIVAILSTATTKKETMKTASNRLYAFIMALIISSVCFHVIGFTTKAYICYIFCFIFLCCHKKWISAIAMDSVLISHFLTFQNMGEVALRNEIFLFIIGVGTGILMNLTLHKDIDYIEKMKKETDEKMREILFRMGQRIGNPQLENYDGNCFVNIQASIEEARLVAQKNFDNQFREDWSDMEYIHMREQQAQVLYEMYKRVNELESVPVSAESIQQFFEKVSREYSRKNTVKDLLTEYYGLKANMEKIDLPQNRKEFEDRARLFSVLRSMEEFLMIKRKYVKSRS